MMLFHTPHDTLPPSTSNRDGGNVLFLILIGVVLFAALSYAIMSSSRTSGGNKLPEDQAKLIAASLIQYAGTVENAVTRVMVANKCADTELSFYNPIWQYAVGGAVDTSENVYPNAPTSKKCHIFHPNGGGIAAQIFEKIKIKNQTYGGIATGSAAISYGSIPNIGTSAPDLILTYSHIQRSVCEQVHRKLGLTVGNWASWPYGYCTWVTWRHAETSYPSNPSCPANVTNLTTWCSSDTSANNAATFYHVILAR